MEEERREGMQEQAVGTPAEAAPEEQRRGGLSPGFTFFLGLIIGVVLAVLISALYWRGEVERANQQVETLNAEVQLYRNQANKLRERLARVQEALSALNEALQELSPKTTQPTQAPTSGGESSAQ